MNKKIKEQWVEALESGEYPKGRHYLRRKEGNEFCCLGVLCDLHSKALGIEWEAKDEYSNGYWYLKNNGFLPVEVAKWAGMNPINYFENVQKKLTILNDSSETFEPVVKLLKEIEI